MTVAVEYRIIGMRCTWSGPVDQVVSGYPSSAELWTARKKGTPLDPGRARPSCPLCGGPVGRVVEADWWSQAADMAHDIGVDAGALRAMIEWAVGKCFPTEIDLARAYAAHIRRERRRSKYAVQ